MSAPPTPDFRLPVGGTVCGLGIDFIECDRIARILNRQGERFLARVFTDIEREYCMAMSNPVPHLAARFAAKEAVSKCFTTGIGAELGWKSIEVRKGGRGEPVIHLDEKGGSLLRALGAGGVLVSLAHTAAFGQAVALIYRPA